MALACRLRRLPPAPFAFAGRTTTTTTTTLTPAIRLLSGTAGTRSAATRWNAPLTKLTSFGVRAGNHPRGGPARWRRWNGGGSANGGGSNGGASGGAAKRAPNAKPASQDTTPGAAAASSADSSTFLRRFLAPRPMPPRHTPAWYREMLLLCAVFAITGSSTMFLVRPAVSEGLGLKGSMRDGPWSYRVCSLVIMTPTYATLLVCVGTVFGRHAYFRHFSVKMFSRFGVPPELMDRNFHKNAKTFRKW